MDSYASNNSSHRDNIFVRVVRFYVEGFRSMTVGRWLWLMIIIKVFLLFAVFKLFFFPNILNERYDTDEQKAEAVRQSLIEPRQSVGIPAGPIEVIDR